jgi:hypothetical protein
VGALIHYCCTNPEHASQRPDGLIDKLTLHDGKWAYCPRNTHLRGHRWTPTGGAPLETIVLDSRAGRDFPTEKALR